MDPFGDVFQPCRLAAAVAVRGQVDRDARDGAVQMLDDRSPRAAIERHAVHEDDRRADPLDVVGQSGLQVCRGCHGTTPERVFHYSII